MKNIDFKKINIKEIIKNKMNIALAAPIKPPPKRDRPFGFARFFFPFFSTFFFGRIM